jgi:hypothetical protein
MTKQQIPKLTGQLVEHQDRFSDLTDQEAQWAILNTTAAIAVCVSAIKSAYAALNKLLEFIGTVAVAATTGKFVAREKFVVNTSRETPVKISYVGDNFTAWFLSGVGKTEDPITATTLRYDRLRSASVDAPIITELGGETKAGTTLTEIYSLMEKQPNGQKGALLNNGWWNIFYVRDSAGVLRAVRVGWGGACWGVSARSVGSPRRWRDGDQVFFRNSALESSATAAA